MNKAPRDLLLYSGDELVLRINFSTAKFDIVREVLLPWQLKGKIKVVPDYIEITSQYQDTQRQVLIQKNTSAITSWLANRTLSLSRKNAKWLYNLIKAEQLDDPISRAKLSLKCRAVSLLDNYWVKLDGDPVTWEDVNLRYNSLNKIIAQVALHGSSLTLQGSLCTPEYTTNGAYAKAWRRYDDGNLWLHKAGSKDSSESRIEVMCSNLLDKMNVSHCYYQLAKDDDLLVCACPVMADDDLSIVDGMSMYSYCTSHDMNFDKFILDVDAENIYKMWIVDYLLSNRDRHGQNWGFYYNPDTMKLLRCHPLFDHNNAFDPEYMRDRNAPYQFGNMTIREAAHHAINKVSFYFYLPVKREDFITDRQYNEFMWRAQDLGIFVARHPLWIQYVKDYNIKENDENAEFRRLHDLFKLEDSSLFWDKLETLLK